MKYKIFLSYNPYTVTTELTINGKSYEAYPELSYLNQTRLQDYLESKEERVSHYVGQQDLPWRGLFMELYHVIRATAKDDVYELDITFKGTTYDFEDIQVAKDAYLNVFDGIKLTYQPPKGKSVSLLDKVNGLKDIYNQLADGPIAELKAPEMLDAMKDVLNHEFYISVIGLMRSGKSTFLNALLHQDLLPSRSMRTTAILTYLRDQDDLNDFRVTEITSQNQTIIHPEPATQALIDQLNNKEFNPLQPEQDYTKEIRIEGNIPKITSKILNAVFVDTPGGNNELNHEDRAKMLKAIKDENNGMVIYVFNGRNFGTSDEFGILKEIAHVMRIMKVGKQAQERFLFVVTQVDEFSTEKGDSLHELRKKVYDYLTGEPLNIVQPKIFLVSSLAAKLARLSTLGRSDQRKFNNFIDQFQEQVYWYWQYSDVTTADKALFQAQSEEALEKNEMQKLVELSSGFPALERAMDRYLNKYAVSIKIKMIYDSFMQRVKKINVMGKQKQKLQVSKKNFDQVTNELKKKQNELVNINTIAETLKKVENLSIDTSAYQLIKKTLSRNLSTMVDEQPSSNHVPKDQAQTMVAKVKKDLEKLMNISQDHVYQLIDTFRKQMDTLLKDYQRFVKSIERAKIFEIGDMKLTDFDRYPKVEFDKLDQVFSEHRIITSKKVTRTVQGSLFRRIVSSFFGFLSFGLIDIDSDETITDEVKEETFHVQGIVKDLVKTADKQFSDFLETTLNDLQQQWLVMKDTTTRGVSRIMLAIEEMYQEINSQLLDQKRVAEEIEEIKAAITFTETIIHRVKELLIASESA